MTRRSPRRSRDEPMAACPDRAAAWISGSEERRHDSSIRLGPPGGLGNDAATDIIFVRLLGVFPELDHRHDARRKLSNLSDPVDDAIAEPESARSAGHQPVHPAAGAVCFR